ncbi:M20 metallopeptidase family protein [Planosporangium mesophilum]|uniref:Amidohydrolase n=1 Tax=Planosporangium mesophilum TaxID=689768 RepID=A0A8J3X1J9_9ACTN|nr:M20 family metallopeptidase [Planosporangium mesophilum]NJC85075.1 amidohydrolase [Planosporangium mesophilum]GII24472.1 amidohydrolase [Planosporangium mesophilum]
MALHRTAEAMRADLVSLRRALHREPEIGLYLPGTQARLLAALDGLPLEITTGRSLSSVTAVLRGAAPGPSVLLRADMDALPVTELAGVPYASAIEGAMHACGHDLHMAMLVGAARLLSGVRDRIAGDVIFMFQPAEEGPGGAEIMIKEGVLEASGNRPIAAYGLHVSAARQPYGYFTTRPGPLMASVDTLRVVVTGAGGHGSQPQYAKDPIPATCEMVLALQTYVTRTHDIFDPVVVTVGSLHAGTADNVIPAQARFEATIRSFSPYARERVCRGVTEVVTGIAQAHGLGIDVRIEDGYPVTVNDDREARFVADTIGELFGPERFGWMAHPEPGAEDFSFVLERVPGTFAFLSACPPESDPATAAPNHSPHAVFDDGVLPDGARLLAELTFRRLAPPVPHS